MKGDTVPQPPISPAQMAKFAALPPKAQQAVVAELRRSGMSITQIKPKEKPMAGSDAQRPARVRALKTIVVGAYDAGRRAGQWAEPEGKPIGLIGLHDWVRGAKVEIHYRRHDSGHHTVDKDGPNPRCPLCQDGAA